MLDTLTELAKTFGPAVALLLIGVWALASGVVVPATVAADRRDAARRQPDG